jgi:hypothetical protein
MRNASPVNLEAGLVDDVKPISSWIENSSRDSTCKDLEGAAAEGLLPDARTFADLPDIEPIWA